MTDRLVRLGMKAGDLTDDLDLVRSGLLDSLAFIDLVASLESATGRRVDLEQALEQSDATTVGGLQRLFD
ncbi:MAG: acyl carrier protein [Flavobacteriales bacterium]